MMDCFEQQDVGTLLSAQKNITFLGTANINNRFAPSIDSNLHQLKPNEKPIVPNTPYELMRNKLTPDVPMIIGLTESEGILGFAGLYIVSQQLMNDLNQNWLSISPDTFGYRSFVPEDKLTEFGTELRQIYMGDQIFSLDTEDNFVDMNSHYIMYRGTKLTAELTSQRNKNVYPYVFTHRGAFSVANYLGVYGRAPTHTDDLQFQFNSISKYKAWPDLFYDTDIEFSQKFVKLWVSFAATGKPTETWGKDWRPANVTALPLGSELPWYSLNRKPSPFKYPQEAEDKYVKMDTLYSLYEKPQRSWRAVNLQKEEL
ncbi:unnamed protein product [Allacma fusca]|uniref:Carboxylesterase type B domain-containing protein n=1 Tax=Allacma fusca TaxID=39272 RepID=A0A8J2NWT0_9HEXA|nr:unnamed protein product [Allacma fusca]